MGWALQAYLITKLLCIGTPVPISDWFMSEIRPLDGSVHSFIHHSLQHQIILNKLLAKNEHHVKISIIHFNLNENALMLIIKKH